MVDTAGMKRYRGPSHKHPLYYRPAKSVADAAAARSAAHDALPDAEKKRRWDEWVQYEADMAQWRRIYNEEGADAADAWLTARRPMGNATSQERAIEKIVDTEARIAVEGDTAMDDVPFGESGE